MRTASATLGLRRRLLPALVLLAVVPPCRARAAEQDSLPPWEGGTTASLGQPVRHRWYAGGTLAADWERRGSALSVLGVLGIQQPLTSPVQGFLAASAEVRGGVRSTRPSAGVRAMLELPVLGFGAGGDYSSAGRLSPVVALSLPLRRGGTVGKGSLFRVDWLTAGEAIGLSAVVPLRQPWAGQTRPRHASVRSPAHPAPFAAPPEARPAVDEVLANVRLAALRLLDLTVPPIAQSGTDPQRALAPLLARLRKPPALPGVAAGPDLQVEPVVRAFHSELARAFEIAATARAIAPGEPTPEGEALEESAREVLLDHILLPFDRLIGQRKAGLVVPGLGAFASGNFAREVLAKRLVGDDRHGDVLYVFNELLGIVGEVERRARQDWHDSRELWLPLQLGLLPEQHQTQPQLDTLLQRAIGQQFADSNRVSYVINESLQEEVRRTIKAARSYHVLWIHDFRGVTESGEPDRMSLRTVVEAYLQGLTDAVRAYDGAHRIPIYLIFLDQHYYELNAARLWLDVLEHPLTARLALRGGSSANDSLRQKVDSAQRQLREAVGSSRLLRVERRQYGESWLESLLSVHVNVTNPADPSFRARGIIPLLGLPDNIIRDHRKIVFYDVSEEDPYAGEALYTGVGVGEHYAGPTWEDRAIMIRGPALLSLKEQARRLLLSQGLQPDQVPFPLRPVTRSSLRGLASSAEGETQGNQRAMELHNQTGYGEKPIDVAKATLYELMPAGSVIKVPDSLWGSSLYAALLAGSAFRGVRVLVIAPSLAAAPASWWPQMALAHDLLARLIVLQNGLGPELEAGGGMLKTGLYNPGMGVQDVLGRFFAAYDNGRRTPFVRRLMPLHESIDSMFEGLARAGPAAAGPAACGLPPASADEVMPKLHLKANFFASRMAWDSMVAGAQVKGAVGAYIKQLTTGCEHPREASDTLSMASRDLVDGYLAALPPEDWPRVVYYLIVGSANHDYRSMYLDGEASVLLSGRSAVVALVDFALLANLSVWVDDLQTLDDLLPPPSGFRLRLARWVKTLL